MDTYNKNSLLKTFLCVCLILVLLFSLSGQVCAGSETADQVLLSLTESGTQSYALRFTMPASVQGTQSVQYIPEQYRSSLNAEYLKSASVSRQVTGGENDFFEAKLTELSPGIEYTYRIGSEGNWSKWYSFATPSASTDTFSFIYMSDTQADPDTGSYAEWGELLSSALEGFSPSFAMLGGDSVNDGDDLSEWADLFTAAGESFASIPLMTTAGNHDYTNTYTSLFNMPKNGPVGLEEYIYSFDYANAHFVVMDSNSMGNSDNASLISSWLADDLADASGATWKIVMFHHPAYNITGNSKDETRAQVIREKYMPVFEQHGVDMILCGHQHIYSRTYPMLNGQVVSHRDGGIVQLMMVSGAKHYQASNYDYINFTKEADSAYAQIEISGNSISIVAKDKSGNLIDEYGWSKNSVSSQSVHIFDENGENELTSISSAGKYIARVPVGEYDADADFATVILQLRYKNALAKSGGAVFSIQNKKIETSQVGTIDFEITVPSGISDRFYADVFYWSDLNTQIPLASPLHGSTFKVNT